jgi:endonuclease YncB( thermonuclease family)
MEGEPESKILAAIEKSNEARERYLTKVSAGSARRADKEKIRTARRKEERKQRKRKLGAWKEV